MAGGTDSKATFPPLARQAEGPGCGQASPGGPRESRPGGQPWELTSHPRPERGARAAVRVPVPGRRRIPGQAVRGPSDFRNREADRAASLLFPLLSGSPRRAGRKGSRRRKGIYIGLSPSPQLSVPGVGGGGGTALCSPGVPESARRMPVRLRWCVCIWRMMHMARVHEDRCRWGACFPPNVSMRWEGVGSAPVGILAPHRVWGFQARGWGGGY